MTNLRGSGNFHQLTFAFPEEWFLSSFQNKMFTIMQSAPFQSFLCVLLWLKVIAGAYFPANIDNSTGQWMTSYIQTGILPQVLLFLPRYTFVKNEISILNGEVKKMTK